MSILLRVLPFLLVVFALSACAGAKPVASYPDRPDGTDKILYSDQKRDTIWGEGETMLSRFMGKDEELQATGGLGVNGYLWRAALDTISFMPVASADPFGGVILTDWYENPKTPGERYKLNIYILDRQLRADGIRVGAFKQKRDGKKGAWHDIEVPEDMTNSIENSILTRARELRVAQAGLQKK